MGRDAREPAGLRARFGWRIGQAIQRAGLDQKEAVAVLQQDGIKVSESSLSRWIRGETQPTLEGLRSLCLRMGVSPEYILAIEDANFRPADRDSRLDQVLERLNSFEERQRLADEERARLIDEARALRGGGKR
jgi:transcriptional regulator with XRE-family HTH domain